MAKMTVKHRYPDTADFQQVLSEASANAKTDWERQFTDELNHRYEQFGDDLFISDKQLELLERLAAE